MRIVGIVEWFNEEKGIGIIKSNGLSIEKEPVSIVVRKSGLCGDTSFLIGGEQVFFDLNQSTNEAVNVSVVNVTSVNMMEKGEDNVVNFVKDKTLRIIDKELFPIGGFISYKKKDFKMIYNGMIRSAVDTYITVTNVNGALKKIDVGDIDNGNIIILGIKKDVAE